MYIYLFIYLTDFVKTAQAEVKKKKKPCSCASQLGASINDSWAPVSCTLRRKRKSEEAGKPS